MEQHDGGFINLGPDDQWAAIAKREPHGKPASAIAVGRP
jgi:hypothetical protein